MTGCLFLDLTHEKNDYYVEALEENERSRRFLAARPPLHAVEQVTDHLEDRHSSWEVVVIWLDNLRLYPDWRSLIAQIKLASDVIKIIIILNEDQGGDSSEIMRSGAFPFACPFNPNVLAGHISAAMEEAEQSRSLDALRNQLSEETNLKSIAQLLLDQLSITQSVGWDVATITMVDDKHSLARTHAQNPNSGEIDFSFTRSVLLHSEQISRYDANLLRPIERDDLILRVIRSNRPLIVSDMTDQDARPEEWEENKITSGIGSWVAMPLYSGRQLIGIITLEHSEPNHYSNADEDFLEKFAEIAGSSLARTVQQRNSHTFEAVFEELSTELDAKKFISKLLEELQKVLGCEECAFLRTFESSGESYLQRWVTYPIPEEDRYQANEKGRIPVHAGGIAGIVYNSGVSEIVPNAIEHEYFSPSQRLLKKGDSISLLVVPVKIKNRTIGVISAHEYQLDYFHPHDRDLVELLAQQVAPLIERSLTLEWADRITSKINSSNDLNQTLEEIVASALEVTNATYGIIFHIKSRIITDSTTEYYYIENKVALPTNENMEKLVDPDLLDPESTTRQLLLSQEISYDTQKICQELKLQGNLAIGVPLLFNNHAIGVLYLLSNISQKTEFNEIEIFSVELFATSAAIAIQKTELITQNKQDASVRGYLIKSTRQIAEEESLHRIFEDIVTQVHKLVDARLSHLAMLYENRFLEFQASYPEKYLGQLDRKIGILDVDNGHPDFDGRIGVIGLAVTRGESILVGDTEKLTGELGTQYIKLNETTRSELAVPIKNNVGEVIGILNLEDERAYAFGEKDRLIVELFAAHVAIAMQKNSWAKTLESLQKATDLVLSSEPEDMLKNIVELTSEAVSAPVVAVILANPPSQKRKSPRKLDASRITINRKGEERIPRELLFIREDGVSNSVLNSGEPGIYLDVQNDPRDINPLMQQTDVQTAVCLPLQSRKEVLGVMWLHFYERKSSEAFDKELSIYSLYASQVASAIGYVQELQEVETQRDEAQELLVSIDDDHRKARFEARLIYFISITTIILGVIIIIGGGVLTYLNNDLIRLTVYTSIAGIMLEAFSILVFLRLDRAHKRVDKFHDELFEIRLFNILLRSTDQLEDGQRDLGKDTVIKSASGYWFNHSLPEEDSFTEDNRKHVHNQ